jgi:ribonuclease HI
VRIFLQSFSARADAEAWVKTNASSSAAVLDIALNKTTQKRKASATAKQASIENYLETAEDDEEEDEDEGWAKKYEPMKPTAPPLVVAGSSKKGKMSTTTTTTVTNKRKLSTKAASADAPRTRQFVLEFDGASRGNPGPAGAGALIRAPLVSSSSVQEEEEERLEEEEECAKGEIIKEICTSLGVATVNEAEYHALLTGLKAAIELGIEDIRVRGDSNLIVSQVKGDWKVKEPRLIPLHAECNEMKKKFRRFDIAHVRREFNKDADALANSAIDDGTHTNDYEYKSGGGNSGGFNGGGGEGLGGGNVNAAARLVRRAHYANIARATLCTMRFARIALL